MLRGILVGIDGSPYSSVALELGLRWAKRFDALLAGLAVIDEPTICRPEPVPPGAASFKVHRDQALLADARQKADKFLEQFAIRCATENVSCKLLEDDGTPAEKIEVEAQRFDLVLLGKESHFRFETQINPDDTLVRVLQHGSRPVVSVPLITPAIGPIVVAYDGSAEAARALQAFEASGLRGDSEVHLVSVARDRLTAARTADRAAQFLSLHNVLAHLCPIESEGHPAEIILDQVQRLGAQMLVMGAYGHRMLREFFLGTVTQLVLRQADVPIFIQH